MSTTRCVKCTHEKRPVGHNGPHLVDCTACGWWMCVPDDESFNYDPRTFLCGPCFWTTADSITKGFAKA